MADLILVPTKQEKEPFLASLEELLDRDDARDHREFRVEVCGFGLVAAAARTAELLFRHTPDRVLLTGIAGAYEPLLVVGEAFDFGAVACYGVGAGEGGAFQPAGQIGWKHWADSPEIGDQLGLASDLSSSASVSNRLLLSVASISSSPEEATAKRRVFPTALAEDMECFAVAVACRLAGVPLACIRGISNLAGQRDKSQWRIAEAIASAARQAAVWLQPGINSRD